MSMHMPTLWDADRGIPKRGVAPVHLPHSRHGTTVGVIGTETTKEPTTCEEASVHIESRSTRTWTLMSDVRLPIGTKCLGFIVVIPFRATAPSSKP